MSGKIQQELMSQQQILSSVRATETLHSVLTMTFILCS